MLINAFIYLISLVINVFTALLSTITVVIPLWVFTGINDMVSGASFLNPFLPMWPHSTMSGIASQTGIMPILGFMLGILLIEVSFILGIRIMKLFVRMIPGNSEGFKDLGDS